ncbi:hypothetical protein A8140_21650 [Vibrio campbellii CAIM 519 = NBRC 15631 = ATCC 25920]|nr:hypothetical protein A8140_21650 [Vibrio campbellii CAIM 519 = NBRC 15631 = ATCC 25920]
MSRDSDLLLTDPYKSIREFESKSDIAIQPLLIEIELGGFFLLWNKQLDNDPSHKWLRELIVSLMPNHKPCNQSRKSKAMS